MSSFKISLWTPNKKFCISFLSSGTPSGPAKNAESALPLKTDFNKTQTFLKSFNNNH